MFVNFIGVVGLSCEEGDDFENNVIFIYGFLLFFLFWLEIVFFEFLENLKFIYCLFVVDVLGFGKSLKFINCYYLNVDYI